MAPSKVTTADRKRLDAALASFHANYSSDTNWGTERWQNSLYPALLKPTRHAALINTFAPIAALQQTLRDSAISAADIQLFQLPELQPGRPPRLQCIVRTAEPSAESQAIDQLSFPPPQRAQSEDQARRLMTHWNLDAASAIAAHVLDAQPGDKVLDLCAAPGGKSLALAQCLWPSGPVENGSVLHLNELDGPRNKRLASNLTSYLPANLMTSKAVRLFRVDGTSATDRSRFPHSNGGYDCVLLDAPCSSERHVIHAQKRAGMAGQLSEELARWRPGAARNLAKTQAALLLSALAMVKMGGRVVYATCAVERVENDGVIERVLVLLNKESFNVRLETGHRAANQTLNTKLDSLTELTEYGRIALPDQQSEGAWGPLFFCVLTKIPQVQESNA